MEVMINNTIMSPPTCCFLHPILGLLRRVILGEVKRNSFASVLFVSGTGGMWENTYSSWHVPRDPWAVAAL
jgi:hypothetical protein